MNTYTYRYATKTTEEEAVNLKTERRGIWEGFEVGKGRENWYNYTTIPRSKRNTFSNST